MRLTKFRILNYRNIMDSSWVTTTDVTAFVGQNEAGKSNLFEALYCLNPYVDGAAYNDAEDWPVDNWKGRKDAKGKRVCEAFFSLTSEDIQSLFAAAHTPEKSAETETEPTIAKPLTLPASLDLFACRNYGQPTLFVVVGADELGLDVTKVSAWAKAHLPKFVLIHDYNFSGTQVELDQLKQRWDAVGRSNRHLLSTEDQTILIVLDLAQIDIDDFVQKGTSADGRTIRQFDKRAASAYLTQQFQRLWTQKKVKFDIDIDGPTLNIFAEDESIGFPVRMHRRSTGFRWYVSFAWKFTHASDGEFENCILLLEEPGVHLHYSGQRDLLKVFDDLAEKNTILYTTHLASMVDQANPERVRIVETQDNHLAINHGVVSAQAAPMAVIEASLGLTADLAGMLGNRKVLIVEGGTDALILNKLSSILSAGGKTGLSEQVYMWPAATSTKAPMYAAFAIGQRWNAGVLLDSDEAGLSAKKKISEMGLKELASNEGYDFRVMMLGEASGIKKTDVAIEDLFPDDFFRECVNRAYGLGIRDGDLPVDGSTLISKRVEKVLSSRYGKTLDKKLVLGEMLKVFDIWKTVADLPAETVAAAEKLFKAINAAFSAT
ncbi:AAA family ATPase [Rhizobium sp. CNPSo 4062]|uniref:ATP-dependent nuclease n=1 Tax=Rhizobium sp. CNPSo 4062 TaxID=3021410 RepID=UPI0025515F58|nr:AAA family ATPase [Rhizobium sp. CNPSo 4062]MDK4702966.1 AAA family ATPase [Rhizobium sp. CNPSo 4062]